MSAPYGMLSDYTTGKPIRAATRQEWDRAASVIDVGASDGVWRASDDAGSGSVYVTGGPDPVVSDDAIRDLLGAARADGDRVRAALCHEALDGVPEARDECVRIIRDLRCRAAEEMAR